MDATDHTHSGMRYVSTRGRQAPVSFERALLNGYASDGGLFVPENLPRLSSDVLQSLVGKPFPYVVAEVLHLFIEDEVPLAELHRMASAAFSTPERWADPSVLPLRRVGHLNILETFWGPTLAFKDVGLQMVAQLFDYFLGRRSAKATVIVETSGDTGPAALAACAGLPSVEIHCLFPGGGRVSQVQQLQMTTIDAANTHVYMTSGTTDDQAACIKLLLGDHAFSEKHNCCSMNSINIARILTQACYYVFTYLKVCPDLSDAIDFVVPTGAFGNSMGGFLARLCGLPIGRIVCATNKNDIVHRIISKGDFAPGENVTTLSPAMDIQLAYNIERFLYFQACQNAGVVSSIMQQVEQMGSVQLDPMLVRNIHAAFSSTCVDDTATLHMMTQLHEQHGYVMCPHSAIGVVAADRFRATGVLGSNPVVCVATAHPAKFEMAVHRATGLPLAKFSTPRVDRLFKKAERCHRLEQQSEKWMDAWVHTLKEAIASPGHLPVSRL